MVSGKLVAASAALFAIGTHAKFFGDTLHQHRQQLGENIKMLANATADVIEAAVPRYLNNKTKPYYVSSLPDFNFPIGELYSGQIPIDTKNPSRNLFFMYYPKIGAPVDEVTIWLNGGPGCSSLEGFLQENGPFTWQPGTLLPERNQYSWANLTNMLWVEQPVGTGFSTGTVTAKSEEDIAADFVKWFKNFEDTFGIKNYKIYVTGESYAGRYVPYISAAMLNQKDKTYYNLSGALVYDPCIGQYAYVQQQVPVVDLVNYNPNLFNFNATYMQYLNDLNAKCGYKDYTSKYLQFPPKSLQPVIGADQPSSECDAFDAVLEAAFAVNPCFNLYDINVGCPLLWDVIGFPGSLEYLPAGGSIYFNRADVKKAIHAPQTVDWAECSGPVFVGRGGPEGGGDLSADPIQKVLPQVIDATQRVLVSNGDFDMIILTNGTLMSIQNMTWGGKLGFQTKPVTPINIQLPDLQYEAVFDENGYNGLDGPQGIMGVQHYERGLMWAETYQSGHMQPQYQPRVSYRHLQWLLGRTNTL